VRSETIFAAEQNVANRYKLCRVLATETRKLHESNTRLPLFGQLLPIAFTGQTGRNLTLALNP
jgi:hypothetical protein